MREFMTEVITTENIDDIFMCPGNYVDETNDLALIKIRGNGNILFMVLIGIDENQNVYLVFEDDEVSEDFYPENNESLWDVYERALDKWLKYDS